MDCSLVIIHSTTKGWYTNTNQTSWHFEYFIFYLIWRQHNLSNTTRYLHPFLSLLVMWVLFKNHLSAESFQRPYSELNNIITNDIVGNEAVASMKHLEDTRTKLESQYISTVISRQKPITELLSHVGLLLFSTQHKKG